MKRRMWISSAAILTLVVGLMAALYFSRAPKASKLETPVTITNETESLQVISSTIEKNRLILTVKNVGDRPIIAYRFDWKAKEGLTGDSATTGQIAPDSQLSVLIPLNQLEQDAKTGLYKLNIAMAFFADGSAEGSWEYAGNYRDKIAGAALAAAQIKEKIAHVNASDISTVEKVSGDLKTIPVPNKLTKGQQFGYVEAIIRARGQMEYMLRQRQSPDEIEKRIIELRRIAERQATLGRNIVEGRQN